MEVIYYKKIQDKIDNLVFNTFFYKVCKGVNITIADRIDYIDIEIVSGKIRNEIRFKLLEVKKQKITP